MNKKIIYVGVAILVLVGGLLLVGFALNASRQQAESSAREANPSFHTVEEGGACVPDRGDCVAGLTCDQGVCAKP